MTYKNIYIALAIAAFFGVLISTISCGYYIGLSTAIGCSVALLPSWLFSKMFFKNHKGIASIATSHFYKATGLKFLSLFILFSIALQWKSLNTGFFLLAFFVMLLACWFGSLFLLRIGFKP